MKTIIIFISLCFLQSCGDSSNTNNVTKTIEDQKQTEITDLNIIKLNGKIGWNNNINLQLSNELDNSRYQQILDTELAYEDLELIGCSNYNNLSREEKKKFVIVFLAAIAERESDFNPEDMTYDSTHKNWNIGLLQIDSKSAIRHSGDSYSTDDLKDSFLNLKVGLSIFQNQITGKYRQELNGKLFTGRSFYWEVLNDTYKNRVIKSFINNRFNLPFCN